MHVCVADKFITFLSAKTPQSRTVASSERRRRQPLSDHNRSMDQEEGDDFKLSAVSSARRSGSRSRIVQTSENEEEEFDSILCYFGISMGWIMSEYND